jgi:hypothetical protein
MQIRKQLKRDAKQHDARITAPNPMHWLSPNLPINLPPSTNYPVSVQSNQTLNARAKAASRLMLEGYAPTTQEKYNGILQKIRTEEALYGVCSFFLPCDSPQKIALFFAGLEGSKWSKVESFQSAITAWHRIQFIPDPPFKFPSLKPFWHGLRKSCDNTVKATVPATRDLVYDVCRYWLSKDTHCGYRNAFVCVMQFWGMRRQGEITQLLRDHLVDIGAGKGFNLRIVNAKNDPYGRGLLVPLPEQTTDNFPLKVSA